MNETEQSIFDKYESQGFDVIHVGVPDFILLKDGEIDFVEVKNADDPLRDSQIRAHALLRKHGFPVKIDRIPRIRHSSLLQEWRENHTNPVHPIPTQNRPYHTSSCQAKPPQSKPLAQATPGQSIPRQPTPIHAMPGHTIPDQATCPNQPIPIHATPFHASLDQAKPEQPKPNHTKPSHKDLWRR